MAAIGFFDSGVGGTSIWKEVVKLLPNEDTIYIADSKNAPYGEKSKKEIQQLCIKNTEWLLSKGCKLIVVACNTATTNAISLLRKKYDVPFIGIEPAIKPAALQSKTKVIGILATQGTLSSELFTKTALEYTKNIEVIEQNGDGLVPLIEKGKHHSPEIRVLLKKYLHPMLLKKIDYLVLGCTHYPYLIPEIKKIVGKNVQIIDSGMAVAKQTNAILKKYALTSPLHVAGSHLFYTNTDVDVLQLFLKDIPQSYSIEKNSIDLQMESF